MKTPKKKTLPVWSLKKPLYLTPKDKRYKKYCLQLKKRGFSDTELWNLDYSIAAFILPRLKSFKKGDCYPSKLTDLTQWNEILDKIITAMEIVVNEEDFEREKELKDGLKLFGEYFCNLWN